MSWVLITVFGSVMWLSAMAFCLTLCRAAALGEEAAKAASVRYFNSRESRRSLRSLPSVWQVGQ